MSDAVETLDGWYCLHDFRTIDWAAWKQLTSDERQKAIDEVNGWLDKWQQNSEAQEGSFAFYAIAGQKADIMFMWMRPTMDDLNEIKTAFNKTRFADFTVPSYSYVSVVELSNYLASQVEGDPYEHPRIKARLYPKLPNTHYLCFYPMDKRRAPGENWYMLTMEERREMMKSHGLIGRRYAGKVKQIITGSVGFDDWEWGVTLFADDVLQFKKLVYEMRFDEVSAKYGEFGPFYVGTILSKEKLAQMLAVE